MSNQTEKTFNLRFLISIIFLGIITIGIGARFFYLNVMQQEFLQKKGEQRTSRKIKTAGYRGMILDRNQAPLAVSTPVHSVWVNPQKLKFSSNQKVGLCKLLNINPKKMNYLLKKNENKHFLYLKRQLSPDLVKPIKSLKITGLYIDDEYKRFYPESEITSQILGFTNVDHKGKEGIELAFDEVLQGKNGHKKIITDLYGREIEFIEEFSSAKPGKDLVLSIDKQMQYFAYKELEKTVKKHKAKSANAVVLNVNTGEVFAMVNYPGYNPNNVTKYKNNFKNKAVTDMYEPGSVMKAVMMAGIVEAGVDLDVKVDTGNGRLEMADGNIVQDISRVGKIGLTDILKKSSNVAMTKLTLELPDNYVPNFYEKMGFNFTTESQFPGESSGNVNFPNPKDTFSTATLSFGYGVAVTSLQLARAYSIIAANGVRYPITFLKQNVAPSGERVLSKRTSKVMRDMLTEVVETGSGKLAKVENYKIAGKTGTARVLKDNIYQKDKHISLFCGIIPAEKPEFVLTIYLEEPSNGEYYGGAVAAPLFKDIATHLVRLYNIAPS